MNNLRQVPREIALSVHVCRPGYYQEGLLIFLREIKSTSMHWTKQQQISRANKWYITRPSYASVGTPTSVRPRNLASMIPIYIWLDCHSRGKSCDRRSATVLRHQTRSMHHASSKHHTSRSTRDEVQHDNAEANMTGILTVSKPSNLCSAGASFAYTSIRISSAGGIERKRIDCASDDRS